MTIRVLIFGGAAVAAGAAGADSVIVHVRGACTVSDVLCAMNEQHPNLRFALENARLAVNHAIARPDSPIGAEDELALLSLLGGG